MFVIVVSLRVKPQMREQFLEVMGEDARRSIETEPGCLRFEVFEDLAEPNHFVLNEAYRDEAAFAVHQTTPHFARWQEVAPPCIVEGSIVRTDCRPAFGG